MLTIKLPRAEIFKFTNGGLYSQYVDKEAVTYYMHSVMEGKPPTPIPAQEKEEWQIGKFSLRQICYVSKSSTARGGVALTYVVLIFPTSKEQPEAALRHAIAAIMRKSGGPDIIDDVGSLLQKWNNLADHPGEFTEKAVPVAWPEQAPPEPETGKKYSIVLIRNCNLSYLHSTYPFFLQYVGRELTQQKHHTHTTHTHTTSSRHTGGGGGQKHSTR